MKKLEIKSKSVIKMLQPVILIPVRTKVLKPGDDIVKAIISAVKENSIKIEEDDIFVITEKVVAYSQGRIINLKTIKPSKEAIKLGKKYNIEPELMQLIINESDKILGGIRKYRFMLTIKDGYMIGNAGIDRSNAPKNHVVLVPKNPKETAQEIRRRLMEHFKVNLCVVIVDSRTQPLRRGLIGLAISGAGFEPIEDLRGQPDLFGKPLRTSWKGTADDIASAAHLLMGEANEQVPIVIVRGVKVKKTDKAFDSKDMYIPPENCLYFKSLGIKVSKNKIIGVDTI